MHYKTEKCAYPISGVDNFLQVRKGEVKMPGVSELEFRKDELPDGTEIVVLNHAN
jgi:hypothetical protein